MDLTPEDVAAIYARACRAWYGKRAFSVVVDKVHELQRRGDAAGVAAWERVAVVLEETAKSKNCRSSGALGKLY